MKFVQSSVLDIVLMVQVLQIAYRTPFNSL